MKINKVKDRNLYRANVRKPDGKYKTIYGKTKKEVREKAESLAFDIKNGKFAEKNNVLVSDWCKEWCENYLIDVSDLTRKGYESSIRNHIVRVFGDKLLQKLTHMDIQNFIHDMAEDHSPKTIRNVINVLHRCLDDAQKNGFIAFNPAENLILPKRVKPPINVLDIEESKEFIKAAYRKSPEYGDCFEFLLLTGLRISEFIGLTVDAYNPNDHMLIIDKQYQPQLNSFVPPKHDVVRKIALSQRAVEIIERRIEEVTKIKNKHPEFNPLNLIFLNPDYQIIKQTTFRKKMKIISREINRPELRVHDLRHTFATITLASGTDIKTLQQRLGHSDATFTMNIYAHSTDTMNIQAAQNLDKIF